MKLKDVLNEGGIQIRAINTSKYNFKRGNAILKVTNDIPKGGWGQSGKFRLAYLNGKEILVPKKFGTFDGKVRILGSNSKDVHIFQEN